MFKQFLDVMNPDDNVIIYDRFRRVIEHTKVENVSDYLKGATVNDMYYCEFNQCIAFKLKVGMFE